MVGRLTNRRALALAALALVVIGVHGCVAHGVAQRLADAGTAAAMPARIEVAYVRELAQAAPVAVPSPVAPTSPPKRERAAREVAAPVSAGEAEPAAAAAAANEPKPEPEPEPLPAPEPPVAAASAAVEPPPTVAEAAPVASAAAAAEPAPFAWPASTRIRYALTGNYRGAIHGHAQVEWVRQGERYQTHVDITVGLPFAPLLSRRMRSAGRLGDGGLQPERYDEDSKVAFRDRRRLTMGFEIDTIVMANGRRLPRPPGVQDTASQFVQLTWLLTRRPELLTPGGTVELLLALPRKIDNWVYDVLAPETLHTPFGDVDTFHLRPRRPAQPGNDLTAEIWFAPSLRYLPVRIRIRQDAETFIDLMIDRPPQLAE